MLHSRRAFPHLASALVAELNAFLWSIGSLASHHIDRIIFETSSLGLREALFVVIVCCGEIMSIKDIVHAEPSIDPSVLERDLS